MTTKNCLKDIKRYKLSHTKRLRVTFIIPMRSPPDASYNKKKSKLTTEFFEKKFMTFNTVFESVRCHL